MIIISNKPGQLGNLLMVYAHFLAYGIETNTGIINPAFYNYKPYFKTTEGFSFTCNYLFYKLCYVKARILIRLGIKTKFVSAIALDWEEKADLEHTKELKSTFCFVQGWQFRSQNLLLKHQKNIREFFRPGDHLQERLNQFFQKKFTDASETIIGVHIRRGDYKNFENGKYFYSIEQYSELIRQLAHTFKGQNPHFLICSNEANTFPENTLDGIKLTFAPGHELLDMYSLVRCSYIAGPPSTYTIWASFYGEVPLCMVYDPKTINTKEDFKIYTLE